MKYLLDTNAYIGYLNGRFELFRQRIDNAVDELIVVCSIVEAELFFGAPGLQIEDASATHY